MGKLSLTDDLWFQTAFTTCQNNLVKEFIKYSILKIYVVKNIFGPYFDLNMIEIVAKNGA